jgi:hypothetical protein
MPISRRHARPVAKCIVSVLATARRQIHGETNWHAYRYDGMAVSSILMKRTGTPKPMIQQELILKMQEKFIRANNKFAAR